MNKATFRSAAGALALTLSTTPGTGLAAADPDAGHPRLNDPDAAGLVARTGVESGLAVHVGTTDGALEAALAAGGRFLVHGLAAGEAEVARARRAIAAAGLAGLATVQRADSFGQLPYADNLVNLVVVGGARAGGPGPPAAAELMRVLAPGGAAWFQRGGEGAAAEVVRKPFPETYDGWPQAWYDATGNPVSADRAVRPPRGVQWIGGIHSEGTKPQNGYRISAGLAVYEATLDRGRSALFARDAFNGLVRWAQVREDRGFLPHFKSKPLLNVGGRIFTVLEEAGGPLVEIDPGTGEVLRRFESGGRTARGEKRTRHDPGTVTNVVHHGDVLLQTAGASVYALGMDDGRLRWRADLGRGEPLAADFPTVDPQGGRVFVATAPTERWKRGARNPKVLAEAVTALDLATGVELWRTPLGGAQVSQVVAAEGGVFLYEAMPIGHDAFSMRRLDARDGRVLWTYEGDKKTLGQKLEMIVRGGKAYLLSHGVAVFDAASGKLLEQWRYGVNARCDSSRATEQLLLLGYGNLADYGGAGARMTHQRIARSSCASGAYPAYGMMYFLPTACGCESWLRGHLALHGRKPAVREGAAAGAMPNERGPAFPAAHPMELAAPGSWPAFRHDTRRSGVTAAEVPPRPRQLWHRRVAQRPEGAAVAADWSLTNDPTRHALTAPTVADGLVFVCVPHAQEVVALDAATGEVRWARTVEGRPDAPPTIVGETAYLTTRHGWVYALRAADGALAWRSRAAPGDELIVAYGALESAWPIFGAPLVLGGAIIVTAGRHPEAGGLWVRQLDMVTGAALATEVLAAEHGWRPASAQGFRTPTNDLVNLAPVTDARGRIHLPGAVIDPAKFRVTAPEEGAPAPGAAVVWYTVDVGTGATRSPAADLAALTYYGPPELSHNASINGMGTRRGALAQRLVVDGTALFAFGLQGRKGAGRFSGLGEATLGGEHGLVEGVRWERAIPIESAAALIKAGAHLVLAGAGRAEGNGAAPPTRLVTLRADGDGEAAVADLPAPAVPEGLAATPGRIFVALEDGSLACFGR